MSVVNFSMYPYRVMVNNRMDRTPDPEYSYMVKLIFPKNKTDIMNLTWHNVTEKFDSVSSLKLKLIDRFSEFIPSVPTFQVGYFGRGNQKNWIVGIEVLKKMYNFYNEGDDIKLWCDGKNKENSRKRSKEEKDSAIEPKSKKRRDESVEDEIHAQLEQKHGQAYKGAAYTLWAKCIKNGHHESYEYPPDIPLITGEQRGKKKR